MRFFLMASVLGLLSGCQWVKPTEGSQDIALVKPTHAANCKKLGTTTSSVRDRVGFVERKERKVVEELILLAKNEAAKLGGDTIVALGEPDEGRQNFEIYQCTE